MSLTVRSAFLEDDKPAIVAFLQNFLTPKADLARFDWLYLNGPHGRARAWVACNAERNIIGISAAFPRRFTFRGTEAIGWVLGDFCLADKYRSLGPALQLQRVTLDSALAEPDFFYDFPSKAMMAVYDRLRIKQTGSLLRWAKPLRLEVRLERLLRSRKAAALAAKAGNALLRGRGWKGPRGSCEVVPHVGACGKEFSELDRSIAAENSACVQTEKSAEYLNWRFLSRELPDDLSVFAARKNGRLVGYVVFRFDKGDARILDLTSVADSGVVARLLDSAVSSLASRGATSVTLTAAKHHPWSATFRRAGFRPREESPFIVATRPGSTLSVSDFEGKWFLMDGERDT
jgi:hypothetical protein